VTPSSSSTLDTAEVSSGGMDLLSKSGVSSCAGSSTGKVGCSDDIYWFFG